MKFKEPTPVNAPEYNLKGITFEPIECFYLKRKNGFEYIEVNQN